MFGYKLIERISIRGRVVTDSKQVPTLREIITEHCQADIYSKDDEEKISK